MKLPPLTDKDRDDWALCREILMLHAIFGGRRRFFSMEYWNTVRACFQYWLRDSK